MHRTGAIRRLVLGALVLGGVCGGVQARAQSSEAATGDWASLAAGGGISTVHLQYGEHWVEGASAFVEANFTWRYGIQGETNWAFLNQREKTHATTYLIGPRYQLAAFGNYKYRPYAKFLVGDGHFNFPYNYATGNYFVMAPGAGLDYWVSPRVRLRLFDLEYQYWPGFTFGSQTNPSVSVGIRYRIR